MKIYDEIPREDSAFHNPVVTIGSFDGVHAGHKRILSSLLNNARQKSGDAVVITFATHPRKILTPQTPPRILTTREEKTAAIAENGIEHIVLLDFTREMSNMYAGEFFSEFILKRMGAIDIVVGYDHAFGKDREGNIDFLRELSRVRGFGITRVEPKNFYSRPISSTWIRTELEDGNIRLASTLLGRPYTLVGVSVRGAGRGQKIGFPTANIVPGDPDKVIPKDGVYAVEVRINGHLHRQGMLNIGTNPTFANTERSIEVNIFDLSEELYGSNIELRFIDRIRDEIKFDSVDGLIRQLERDREAALDILNE